VHGEDERLFDWAVGPSGWKAEFFPPRDEVWRARRGDGTVQLVEIRDTRRPLAVIGARPCEVAALQVLDRVFVEGAHQDTHYADRRENAFIAVVECSSPAATCFCDSMKAGPNIEAGFDLALTELDDDDGHRFVARVGSPRALAALNGVASTPVTPHDISARTTQLDGARSRMVRHLDVDGVAGLLARNLEHPRWADVAERCLSCGNCTLVCPTCFCCDVRDVTDLDGAIVRQRTWSSCFSVDHSYLHGGSVRPTTQSRYRQWMTHKLSSWWDQFDTTGCVGCGRCVAWCPVGIDITEEASAIARSDGATALAPPSVRGAS
jgi:ferredoxin